MQALALSTRGALSALEVQSACSAKNKVMFSFPFLYCFLVTCPWVETLKEETGWQDHQTLLQTLNIPFFLDLPQHSPYLKTPKLRWIPQARCFAPSLRLLSPPRENGGAAQTSAGKCTEICFRWTISVLVTKVVELHCPIYC